MTILQEAYGVCKYVRTLPSRSSVADLMRRINFSSEKEGHSAGRYGNLGQQGRQARSQFVGYLSAIQNLEHSWGDTLAAEAHPFLRRDELMLLQEAHHFLLDINAYLLESVSHRIAGLAQLINPYSRFMSLPQYLGPQEYDMQCKPIRLLCEAFGKHPAWNRLSSIPFSLDTVSPENGQAIEMRVENMIGQIHAAGCAEAPPHLVPLDRMARSDPQGHWQYRMLTALVALQSSLINLDQLIYQAYQYDKLPVLGENNIFAISWGSHTIGHYTNVSAVPTESTFHLEPGDLVLVKITLDDRVVDSLHCIGSSTISFSQETGPECEYQMRRVDENLNCYEGLID